MKSYLNPVFIFIIIIFLFSCQDETPNINIPKEEKINYDTIKNLKPIDQYAKFISGFACEELSDYQEKDVYKNYSKSNETNWNYFSVNQLFVIKNWTENKKISTEEDTATVFYPFAGPDFTFAYAFYPHAKNYLLIGLENIGEIPNLKEYSDLEIAEILNSMTESLTEFYTQGYFSTLNMKYNFRKSSMNGVVHPLLYFIYRTNHQITDFEFFVIDKYGRKLIVDKHNALDKRIKGLKISFDGQNGHKNLYYLQVDLTDVNFKNHPELTTFISNFGEKNTFLKSASYLLQESDMISFRDLLIQQSLKIIQDDSGFSFNFLKLYNYDIKVFGNYNRTLNLFQDYWQPDLKEEFTKQNAKKLPFRFGYNVPFDETAIIFADAKENQTEQEYPIYKVQLRMSWEQLPADSFPDNFTTLDYYFDEGYYKYTLGKCNTEQECREVLEFAKNNGYKDAFLVEFTKDSRTTLGQ